MTELTELLSSFELGDNGYTETGIQGIRLFKGSQHIPRKPLVYGPGICIVAQGRKVGYLAGEVFHYNADNYLVTMVTMPFECETLHRGIGPAFLDAEMKNGVNRL